MLQSVIRSMFVRSLNIQGTPRNLLILRCTTNYISPNYSFKMYFSSESPANIPWNKMSKQQQDAWMFLGWSENAWNGLEEPPTSDSALWSQLTPEQQSAAKYGLGYTSKSWDNELLHNGEDNEEILVQSSQNNQVSNVKNTSSSKSTGILSSIFSVFKSGATIVDTGIDITKDPLSGIQDLAESVTNAIEITSTEAILYIDNSGSMTFGKNLKLGHQAFDSIFPLFKGIPTRVIVFGSYKDEIVKRSENLNGEMIKNRWDGGGGGTYLWHMIDRDIVKRYKPGKGTLRVYVITDGEDMQSPFPYCGPKGMNPLMEHLLGKHYHIEWNIIVLGMEEDDESHQLYHDLCLATGGSFLSLNSNNTMHNLKKNQDFINKNPKVKKFVDEVRKAHGNDVSAKNKIIQKNRAEYEKKLKQGKAENFTWLHALPPPPHQK